MSSTGTDKKAQKPAKSLEGAKVAQGEKSAPKEGEVSGHMSLGGWYLCWHCGARNYVPYGWNYFYCWNDYALNAV